ncbi:MAG: hypothetical protein ACI93P_002324, partial [bacterium]
PCKEVTRGGSIVRKCCCWGLIRVIFTKRATVVSQNYIIGFKKNRIVILRALLTTNPNLCIWNSHKNHLIF